MKLYSCIAVSNNIKSIEVQGYLVYAESEDKARQSALRTYNAVMGQYPQRVKVVMVNFDSIPYA